MTQKEGEDPPAQEIPTKVIQIANIASQTTRDQMQTLFSYVGKLEDIKLYPTSRDMTGMPIQCRICYIKFQSEKTVPVALQLNNTIYIDRPLIVTPWMDGDIPDETPAIEMAAAGIPGLLDPKLPNHLTNHIQGVPPNTLLYTHDPNLLANGLSPYPILPARTDGRTVEETRRTLTLLDVDRDLKPEQVFAFFAEVGSEVAFFRFCKKPEDAEPSYALLEFGKQEHIINALKLNGTMLGNTEVKIAHALTNIQKPQMKTQSAVQKEIEEAMRLAKDSTSLFAALDGDRKRSRSRSLSRGRHRRSSATRSRRSRSRRSRSRRRSRTRSRDRRRRSRTRSRDRKRGKSRERKRKSRTRSRDRKKARSPRRSTSRTRSRRDRDRPSKDRESTKKEIEDAKPDISDVKAEKSSSRPSSRSVSRRPSRSPPRKSPSRRRSRSPAKRSRTPKKRSRSRDRDIERKRKGRSKSPGVRRRPSRSPRRLDRKRSRSPRREETRKRSRTPKREEKAPRTPELDDSRRSYGSPRPERSRGHDRDDKKMKVEDVAIEEDMDMDTSNTP